MNKQQVLTPREQTAIDNVITSLQAAKIASTPKAVFSLLASASIDVRQLLQNVRQQHADEFDTEVISPRREVKR